MRTLLTISLLWALCVNAQCPPPQKVGTNYQFKAAGSDTAQRLPIVFPSLCWLTPGAFMYNMPDSNNYKWTGNQWLPLDKVDNGLSDSVGVHQLGMPELDSHNHGFLTDRRGLAMNGFNWRLWRTMYPSNRAVTNDSSFCDIWDTAGGVGFEGPVGVRIRQGMVNGGTFQIWEPWNYDSLYTGTRSPSGTMRPGRILSGYSSQLSLDPMPDNVYDFFAYNENFSSGRLDTTEAAIRVAMETNFLNTLNKVQLNFEYHDPEITLFDGTEVRTNSYYIGKEDGYCLQASIVADHEYSLPPALGGVGYFGISSETGSSIRGVVTMHGSNNNDDDGRLQWAEPAGEIDIRGIGASTIGKLQFESDVNPNVYPLSTFANGDAILNDNEKSGSTDAAGQTYIGNYSTATLEPTAQLQVNSISKGFITSRMTTIQKLAIVSPAEGLMVYDLTLHQMSYFNGTTWINF